MLPKTEKKIGLAAAAAALPGNRGAAGLHAGTLARWARKGVPLPNGERLYLEVECLGAKLLTSTEAIERFVAAKTSAEFPHFATPISTPAERTRRAARADAALAAALA